MTDRFARQTAQHAHARIAHLEAELQRRFALSEKAASRRSTFTHRCHLCGDPTRKGSRYCHAHSWAEGGT